RGWWINRSRNAAWAAVHPEGVDSEEVEAEQRPSRQISEEELGQLRRYYWKSLWVRYALVAWPWVVTGLALLACGYLLDQRQQVDTSKIQVAALTPYFIADAVIKGVEQRQSDYNTDERQAAALMFESAAAAEMLHRIEKPKTGAFELYRKWRQGRDDPTNI